MLPNRFLTASTTTSMPFVNPLKSAFSSAAGRFLATVSSVSLRLPIRPSTYSTSPPILPSLTLAPMALNTAAMACAMPPNSSSSGAPMRTNSAFKELETNAVATSTLPCILAKASPTAPAELPMLAMLSLNLSASGPVRDSTLARPVTSPNRIAILSVLPPVAAATSPSTPARPLLFRAAALNSMPRSFAMLAACSLGLMMLLIADLSASIAVDGCIPPAVSVAMAAPTSSSDTPAAAEIGVRLARYCPRSLISILPSAMIWKNRSETLPASSVLMP